MKREGVMRQIRANSCLLTAALIALPIFAQRPVELADPFVGTSGDHGQTFPGAILPFGMVAASPDTYPSSLNHDAHAGYNYEDKKIVGFSHFRMSGVGCEGLGGILSILPLTGDPNSLDPATYAQLYDKASPHNGRRFIIDVYGDPNHDFYIQSATLNGRELSRAWLRDSEIRAGGTLNIRAGPIANKAWGVASTPY